MIQLLNSTGSGDEGEDIIVCAELTSINGELGRPLSVSTVILSGTAECKGESFCDYKSSSAYDTSIGQNDKF